MPAVTLVLHRMASDHCMAERDCGRLFYHRKHDSGCVGHMFRTEALALSETLLTSCVRLQDPYQQSSVRAYAMARRTAHDCYGVCLSVVQHLRSWTSLVPRRTVCHLSRVSTGTGHSHLVGMSRYMLLTLEAEADAFVRRCWLRSRPTKTSSSISPMEVPGPSLVSPSSWDRYRTSLYVWEATP